MRALGLLVVVGVCAAAIARAMTAPVPDHGRTATFEQRKAIFRQIVQGEPAQRSRTARQFPGDRWSQDDAFHSWELGMAQQLAARSGLELGEVLLAIDQGIREGWFPETPRSVTAAPCKPRPFYD